MRRVKDEKSGEKKYANSAILIGRDGKTRSIYEKIHLVPFGEYVPWGLPIGKLVSAIGDFAAGSDYTVMDVEKGGGKFSLGAVICYEIIFPDLVRKFPAAGARMIVNVTNDAWFGTTAGPYQHFAMAVFRAVENRVPVVRAANTGISGIIDDRGRIIRESRLNREETIVDTVEIPSIGSSFYRRFGNVFGYLSIVTAILITFLKGER